MIAEHLGQGIHFKVLSVLEAPGDLEFFLSDNPVLIVDQAKKDPSWPQGWELGRADVSICLPISRKRCLLLGGYSEKLVDIEVETISAEFVDSINYISTFYAEEELFGGVVDLKLQTTLNSTTKPHSYT